MTFLAVIINGFDTGVLATLMVREGEMLMRVGDMETAGLIPPAEAPVEYQGERYKRLLGIPSLVYTVDDTAMQMVISCSSACYKVQTLTSADGNRRKPDEGRGVALDYDLMLDYVPGESRSLGGMFDGSAAFLDGTLKASFVQQISDSAKPSLYRLESSWTYDDEEDTVYYRLGDSVTRGAAWSVPVRFAGLQIATDFSLQPGYIYFPTPSVNGEAALPSTLEVFANDIRRFQGKVTPGPFSVTDMPVLTGNGELRAVIVDALGREQVIVEPYFATPDLLKPDVSQFSIQAGVMRADFGMTSFDYDTPFAAIDYRRGLAQWLTQEVQAEATREIANIGVGLTTAFGSIGLIELAAAHSRTRDGERGYLYRAGYGWQSRLFNFGINGQYTTSGFRQIGMVDGALPPRLQVQSFLSVPLFDFGSLSLTYAASDQRDGADTTLASATVMAPLGTLGTLALTASHLVEEHDTSLMLSFTTFFGPLTTGSVSAQRSNDGALASAAQINMGTPIQGGLGGYVTASSGDSQRADGGVRWRGDHGIFDGQAAIGDTMGFRLGARGSVISVDGETFLGPPTRGSYALVKVGDYPNVAVLQDHRPTAVTDEHGMALLTGLRPYDFNHISFEATDLPLDADLASAEVQVVPRRNVGAVVQFKVEESRGLSVILVGEDGEPLPPGTPLDVDGQPSLLVGHEGEAYVNGMERSRRITARLAKGRCSVEVAPAPPDVLRVGPLTCAAHP